MLLNVSAQLKPERQWPCYRGYLSSGVLDKANLPETFDIPKMINVLWKIEIPGLGLSSPVIWGDRLFITSAISKSDNQGIKPGIYGDGMPVPDSLPMTGRFSASINIQEKPYGKGLHIVVFQKSGVILNPLTQIHPLPLMVNMLLLFLDQKVCIVMIMMGSLSGKRILAF